MKPKKNHIWLFFDFPELITVKPDYKDFTFKFTDSREGNNAWDYFDAIDQFNYTFYTDIFKI